MATSTSTQIDVTPLSEREQQMWDDIQWAQQDHEVQQRYAGEWIALYKRSVVAHAPDCEQCLRNATATTGIASSDLTLWPIPDVDSLLVGASADVY